MAALFPALLRRRCAGSSCRSPGELSGSEVALSALADIDLLADCTYLVINLRSAVSRLALGLAVARQGRHVPFISVQWPWGGVRNP